MYFINQMTQDDCAFTSLKILLANLKEDETYLYLKEDEKHGPYSYQELCDISKEYGVELLGFRVENKEEIKLADVLPMIVTIKVDDSLHAVCLYSINKRDVTLLDPSIGKVKIKYSNFFELWNGTGLLISHENRSEKEVTIPIEKERNNIFDYVFQFLAGAAFLFSLVAMSLDNFAIFSLIGLGVSILFEIISRIIKVKKMKQFDLKMMEQIENIENSHFDKFLIRKEKYKESVFSNKNNILYYMFVSIFMVFTIILGDPRNAFCIFLPILLAILQSQIFSKKEKQNIAELEKLEDLFNRSKSFTKVKMLYENIHNKSYKFANFLMIKKGIGIILFGVSAAISLLVFGTLNLINFLFLLFTEIYLYQNFCSLLSYENSMKERKMSFMRLINIL